MAREPPVATCRDTSHLVPGESCQAQLEYFGGESGALDHRRGQRALVEIRVLDLLCADILALRRVAGAALEGEGIEGPL